MACGSSLNTRYTTMAFPSRSSMQPNIEPSHQLVRKPRIYFFRYILPSSNYSAKKSHVFLTAHLLALASSRFTMCPYDVMFSHLYMLLVVYTFIVVLHSAAASICTKLSLLLSLIKTSSQPVRHKRLDLDSTLPIALLLPPLQHKLILRLKCSRRLLAG